jgi:hypothetical protein
LTVDERRLDGNAAGGLLGEVFALEMTMVEGTCDQCGAVAHVGEAMAYISEIGTVLRCASCDNALIRISRGSGRYWLDLRGVRYLQIEEP